MTDSRKEKGSIMTDTGIEKILDEMTLTEQVALLSGEDFWSLPAIARVGIGKLRVTDGPNGARGGGSLIGGVKSAAFPVGIALGATWDPDIVREIGGALAEEAKSKGAHVLLGPTINIQRSVTNGRNFECFSEDPVLTAELAVAYVEGLQAVGRRRHPEALRRQRERDPAHDDEFRDRRADAARGLPAFPSRRS